MIGTQNRIYKTRKCRFIRHRKHTKKTGKTYFTHVKKNIYLSKVLKVVFIKHGNVGFFFIENIQKKTRKTYFTHVKKIFTYLRYSKSYL